MDWITTVREVLHYELFEIGAQGISLIHFVLLALILAATYVTARYLGELIEKRLVRLEAAERHTVIRVTHSGIWIVGVLLGLGVLNVNLTTLAVVAGALGIGIGFGLQATVANFVAGLILLFDRPIKINDYVTVGEVDGTITDINFRATTVVTPDNVAVIVPNSEFVSATVVNWSLRDPLVRVHVPVGVAYGSDVERVTRTLLEAAVGVEDVLAEPEPAVWFKGFGDSALEFELLVWVQDPRLRFRLRSRLYYAISAAVRREGIQIPFPQRDVHIRSAPALEPLLAKGAVQPPGPGDTGAGGRPSRPS